MVMREMLLGYPGQLRDGSGWVVPIDMETDAPGLRPWPFPVPLPQLLSELPGSRLASPVLHPCTTSVASGMGDSP
jgi:hypothetical protein